VIILLTTFLCLCTLQRLDRFVENFRRFVFVSPSDDARMCRSILTRSRSQIGRAEEHFERENSWYKRSNTTAMTTTVYFVAFCRIPDISCIQKNALTTAFLSFPSRISKASLVPVAFHVATRFLIR